jgi:hypothetical protein
MANFRRRRPRYVGGVHGRGARSKWECKKIPGWDQWGWINGYPAYWDRIYHSRPRRSKNKALERAIVAGRLDPDDAAWPLGNHKPHQYYW